MTEEEIRVFKENHSAEWKTFFKIYSLRKEVLNNTTFKIALAINILVSALVPFGKSAYDNLTQSIDIILSVFPNLLGFSLGAYALLTGVFTANIIERVIKKKITDINLFQLTSATFAASLLTMSLTLIIVFFTKQIMIIDIFSRFNVSDSTAKFVNTLIFFLLNLPAAYSILLLINNIKNMFGLNQFVSSVMSMEVHLKKKDSKD